MPGAPTTQPSLLLRLRDARDDQAWSQFVDLYAPLVYGYARRRGLQDADAADLMQIVLRTVASAVGRLDYDPRRGSFRGWLFTIVRNKLASFLGRRDFCQGAGDEPTHRLLEAQAAPEESSVWDAEYEQRLFVAGFLADGRGGQTRQGSRGGARPQPGSRPAGQEPSHRPAEGLGPASAGHGGA
jgi:RNA polymerase sigma-70 factor (ECF subfamily)